MKLGRRSLRWCQSLEGNRVRLIDSIPPLAVIALAVPGLVGAQEAFTLDVLLVLILTALLVFRRRYPLLVFAAVCAVGFAQRGTGQLLVGDIALIIAFYTLASMRSAKVATIGLLVMEAGIALDLVWWPPTETWLVSFLLLSGLTTTAGVLGVYARTRAAFLSHVRERAERLERERDQQFALAAADERAHIARELHDIVAHHLTVMIALADGAATTVSSSPARATEVMATVSATGRKALADTRRLLDVLRADDTDAELRPLPDISRLTALLEQVRSAGLPVTMTITGQQRELSPALQLTVYRLIQEALTNTLKHGGPGAQASLRLSYAQDEVSLDVRDDGLASAGLAPNGSESSRHGLNGMRERVAAWDGDLRAGPAAPRGWLVSARLRTVNVQPDRAHAESVPGKSVPGKSVPGKSVPGKSVPAESVPADNDVPPLDAARSA